MKPDFSASDKLKALLPDPDLPFIHRDLSWIQFNDRVLGEARTLKNPLLERLKFLSISAANLDEFFMIRVATIMKEITKEVRAEKSVRLERLKKIRHEIFQKVAHSNSMQENVLHTLAHALKAIGVEIILDLDETEAIREHAREIFKKHIQPELKEPEPFQPKQLLLLSNLQWCLIFLNSTWIRIPRTLKSVWCVPIEGNRVRIYFSDALVLRFASETFKSHSIKTGTGVLVRLTRDGDLSINLEDEDAESVPAAVRATLKTRDTGRAVRLQSLGHLSEELDNRLQKAIRIPRLFSFSYRYTFLMHHLWSVLKDIPPEVQAKKGLTYPPFTPYTPPEFSKGSEIFKTLKARDILLHHPYDSFDALVQWVKTASLDPQVKMIQQTIYRMDSQSPLLPSLIQAAKAGKKVRVVIELRARFDELNNLQLTEELQNAGIEVAFGFGKLKLHAKLALVSREEEGVLHHYTHLSTGNYNSSTSRLYTDLSIITADADIGADALHFFDAVARKEIPQNFKKLLAAPIRMHRRIIQLIDHEINAAKEGKSARIFAKVNSLVDQDVVIKLYEASEAGVEIDLVVRGACALVPGIRGLSKNIRVMSIVDRYLEHSRIYYFESSKILYLSSADWMPRNFFSRLELAFPVLDHRIFAYIRDVIIPIYGSDNFKSRELTSDGYWAREKLPSGTLLNRAQFLFQELARKHYQGTPLAEFDR